MATIYFWSTDAVTIQMNRPIDALIRRSGLQINVFDRFVMPETPRILGEMYRGVAGWPKSYLAR
jgi:hypothetical protein